MKYTKLLQDNRIKGKGWPYRYTSNKKECYAHTLSTWLSILALDYMPEEIRNAIPGDWEKEFTDIKTDVKKWLIEEVHKENDLCSWSFRPGETADYNPVATAQALLALHATGVRYKKDDTI